MNRHGSYCGWDLYRANWREIMSGMKKKTNRNLRIPKQEVKQTPSGKGGTGKHPAKPTKKAAVKPVRASVHPAKRPAQPKTEKQFFALSDHAQEQWRVAEHVIQKMRSEGISLTRAAKEYGIDRKKVIELGGSALRKQKNGRYKAKSFDRLLRVLVIPSKNGLKEVAVRDSRTASKLASYSAAVHRFLQTGDKSKLREFKTLRITTADGKPFRLLTDPKELMRLGSEGVLSFESLYARVA